MKHFLMILPAVFFFSCQKKDNNETIPVSNPIPIEKVKKDEIETQENKQIGDTIFMSLMDEKGLLTAEGVLDSIHPRAYVKFKNENIGQLKAAIIPTTGKGNIRFNQVIFPDETSDGPFGMDLEIKLEQKGNYVLVIGHSQMADNPFWGKFKVNLENKKE